MLITCAYLGTLVSIDPDPMSQSMVRRFDSDKIEEVIKGTGSLLSKSFLLAFLLFLIFYIAAFVIPISIVEDQMKIIAYLAVCVVGCLSVSIPSLLGTERRFQKQFGYASLC